MVEKEEAILELTNKVERLEGAIEAIGEERKNLEERLSKTQESVGDLRRMVLERKKETKELEKDFEKVTGAVREVEPEEIKLNLEKKETELDKFGVELEKLKSKLNGLEERTKEIREVFPKLKSVENLVEVSEKVGDKLEKIEEDKRYTDRLASKVESIFADLNEKLAEIGEAREKLEAIDDLSQELRKKQDDLEVKFDNVLVKRDELEELRKQSESLKNKFGRLRRTELGMKFDLKLESLNETFERIKERMENLSLNPEMEEQLSSIKAEKEELEEKEFEEFSGEGFQDEVRKSCERIEKLDSSLKNLEQRIIFGQFTKLRENISTLREETVKTNQEEIDEIKERISEFEPQFEAREEVESAIETNRRRFKEVSEELNQRSQSHAEEIRSALIESSQLKGRVNKLDNQIQSLMNTQDELKEELESRKLEVRDWLEAQGEEIISVLIDSSGLKGEIDSLFDQIEVLSSSQTELKEELEKETFDKLRILIKEIEKLKERKLDRTEIEETKQKFNRMMGRYIELLEKSVEE